MTMRPQQESSTDPFTCEVITDTLQGVAEEMFLNLGRAAKSSVIYETLDYACGITDPDANVIAQANGIPDSLGTLKFCVEAAVEKFGADDFEPGDVAVTNDYRGGTHLNDVAMVTPVLTGGDLVGFIASKTHWTDIGGKSPGSWSTDATSIFQEGIQYPVVELYDGGELNEDVRDIVVANARMPEITNGGMQAQKSSMDVGADRVVDIYDRYGVDTIKQAVEEYFDAGERLVHEEIRNLPNSTYETSGILDNDGTTDDPVHVEVTVTITDDAIALDYTGSDPETQGPINAPYAASVSDIRSFFQAITLSDAETNEGFFRPLGITIPEDIVLNVTKPAAIGTDWEGSAMASDLPWEALTPHPPDRLSAGHFFSVCATIAGGHDECRDEDFLVVEPQPGGWGGSPGRDGVDVLVYAGDGDTLEIPAEVMETRFPLLFDELALDIPQESGYGEFRGGTGLVQGYQLYNESGGFITAEFGRSEFPPWGIEDGHESDGNYIVVERTDGSAERRSDLSNYDLDNGDITCLVTSSGGGWGDPTERNPESVRVDYLDDYITRETAQNVYGVILDENGTIDHDATAAERGEAQ